MDLEPMEPSVLDTPTLKTTPRSGWLSPPPNHTKSRGSAIYIFRKNLYSAMYMPGTVGSNVILNLKSSTSIVYINNSSEGSSTGKW